MAKYIKAFIDNDRIVDIQEVGEKDRNRKFSCIGCGKDLKPRLGKIREHHFYHKDKDQSCSEESYLHKTAKLILYNNIKERILSKKKLYLNIEQEVYCKKCFFKYTKHKRCFLGKINTDVDILKRYNQISLEKNVNGFIPDICLYTENPDDYVFIEIFVSHQSSRLKVSSNSKIVEIRIKREDDLEYLDGDTLNPVSLQTKMYNFKTKKIFRDVDKKACTGESYIFTVRKDGYPECIKIRNSLIDYKKEHYAYLEILDKTISENEFKSKIIDVYRNGIHVKSCYLCKNHTLYLRRDGIYCSYYKQMMNRNYAISCGGYKINVV